MQDILDKIVDSRILDLLEIININYPDKFKKSDIEKEITYIKKHIIWKEKNPLISKKILHEPKHKIKFKTKLDTKLEQNKNQKIKVNTNINVNQCFGRKWSKYIYNKKSMKKINNVDDKFKVDDFIDLNIKEFNSKYIIGLRCCKNKIDKSKYCKLHTKHLIHGDYLELPNKELCYHFMKDGKYL